MSRSALLWTSIASALSRGTNFSPSNISMPARGRPNPSRSIFARYRHSPTMYGLPSMILLFILNALPPRLHDLANILHRPVRPSALAARAHVKQPAFYLLDRGAVAVCEPAL